MIIPLELNASLGGKKHSPRLRHREPVLSFYRRFAELGHNRDMSLRLDYGQGIQGVRALERQLPSIAPQLNGPNAIRLYFLFLPSPPVGIISRLFPDAEWTKGLTPRYGVVHSPHTIWKYWQTIYSCIQLSLSFPYETFVIRSDVPELGGHSSSFFTAKNGAWGTPVGWPQTHLEVYTNRYVIFHLVPLVLSRAEITADDKALLEKCLSVQYLPPKSKTKKSVATDWTTITTAANTTISYTIDPGTFTTTRIIQDADGVVRFANDDVEPPRSVLRELRNDE